MRDGESEEAAIALQGRKEGGNMGNVTCGQGEKGVGKGGRGAGVDILAVGQNFGNVEGNIVVSRHGHIHFERTRCRRTIHFERLCASQTILLLYAHGMSLIIQILVEISPGTSLHNLTSLANLGTQKSVQQTDHTY